MLKALYYRLSRPFRHKNHRLLVEILVASVAAYFVLERLSSWSLSQFLGDFLLPGAAKLTIELLLLFVYYGVAMKVILLVLDAFPATRVKSIESDGLAHCCLRINDEIARHTASVIADPEKARRTFLEHHNFEVNVALVVECLHKHIAETLQGAGQRDIFVSVYIVPDFTEATCTVGRLDYLTHQPTKRDVVVSRQIDINEASFAKYECVKCLHSTKTTQLVLDCSNYFRSNAKRLKNICHYVGMKIEAGDVVAGFINIEFYNTKFFTTEEEMSGYVEQQLLPFRYLMEYQFSKRRFFSVLEAYALLRGVRNGQQEAAS